MYAKIVVKAVPALGKDVEFYADLPAGFMEPAIGRAMEEAFSAKLFGELRFSRVIKVLLRSESSASRAPVPLIGEDLIPDGYYVTVPAFEVLCEWPAEEDDELERAFDRMGVLFGESTVKPILACPLTLQIAKGPPPGSSAEGGSPETAPVEPRDVTPKRLKVYFSSAVHEEYRGGDADFMKSMVDGLRALGVEAVRLANSMMAMGDEQRAQHAEGKLVTLDYYGALTHEQRQFKESNLAAQLEAATVCMLEYFAAEMRENPDILPLLHIQSRLPSSGSAFATAATIRRFKEAGISVFVTVHEWLYNKVHIPTRAESITVPTLAICQAAHGAIFVNDLDQRDAAVAESTFIPIPITVAFESIDVEAVLARPSRVLMFGMLRPGKGFERAADLGAALQTRYLSGYSAGAPEHEQRWAVWVVGKLTGIFNEFEALVKNVFKAEIYKQVFPEPGWLKKLDIAARGDDDAFNSAVSEKLRACDALRAAYYARHRLHPPRPLSDIKADLLGMPVRPEIGKATQTLLKNSGSRIIGDLLASAQKEYFEARTGAGQFTCNIDDPEYLRRLESDHVALVPQYAELLAQRAWAAQRDHLLAEERRWDNLPLPVFFKLNLDEPALVETFKQCKYVYKPDDKGMADNASAMISPMANGCILFTSWGAVTPAEFKAGPSSLAPVEAPERFKLDFASRYAKAIVLSGAERAPMTPESVIESINAREADGNASNRATLESLKHLTEHRYLPIMVAARHVIYYRRRMFGTPRTILIPKEEHH